MTATTFPVILAGQRVTAGLLASMLTLAVIKPADEPVTSSNTLQNDNDLLAAVVANASYDFDCYLDYEGGTINTSDLKWQWAVPSGATMRYQAFYVTTSNALGGETTQLGSDVVVAGTKGAGVLMGVKMSGSLVMASTAGNMQLTWAQNTINGTATIVHAQSYLKLKRSS